MIRIGIICPSEIANRRFLPALNQLPNFKFIGVAYANKLDVNNNWIATYNIQHIIAGAAVHPRTSGSPP